MPKGHIGSSFERFLKEQGTYEDTTSASIKRVTAWQERAEDADSLEAMQNGEFIDQDTMIEQAQKLAKDED